MNYNKAELCKDCKMPEKPIEKYNLAGDLNTNVNRFIGTVENLISPASKILNLAKKIEREGQQAAREGGDRDSSDYYDITMQNRKAAARLEESIGEVLSQSYNIAEITSMLKRYERTGTFR